MKIKLLYFVLTALFLFTGCVSSQREENSYTETPYRTSLEETSTNTHLKSAENSSKSTATQDKITTATPTPVSETPPPKKEKFYAWVTYWDTLGVMEEALLLGESLDSISFFAAYFNENDELFVPDEINELLEEFNDNLLDSSASRYITIVNDKVNSNGSSSLKDIDLLYNLLASDDAVTRHVDEIIDIAIDGGYEGIEIDYERIRDDIELWDYFLDFVSLLYDRAQQEGFELRIVLEPLTPFEQIEFPEGPEYVMMCYNLYGGHSGPGPKADEDFLRQLAQKMAGLPGDKTFAFATGGFDWTGSNKAVSITESTALSLIENYSAETTRYEASMCAVFSYKDADRKKHEVWYADSITLQYWIDVIKEYNNYSFAIWRLGGNESLDRIADDK